MSESLADLVRRNFPAGVRPAPPQPSYMTDPVAWVRDKQPKIETKTQGLITFEPYDYQQEAMRYFAKGGTYFVRKSRQMGWTTLLLSGAVPWALLWYLEVKGRPLHFHLIADTGKKTLALLRKVKIALSTAKLTSAERRWLKGIDPEAGSDEVRYNPRAGGTSEIQGFNSALAHPTTGAAVRSFDGNGFLIEEAAEISILQTIWNAAYSMITDVPDAPAFVVSTPGSAGHFFTELCETPGAWGGHYLPYESIGLVPGHDATWEAAERARLGDQLFEEEQGLRASGEGTPIFDGAALMRHAAGVVPLGIEPLPGHRYSNAVDNSGPGQDCAAWVTTDLGVRPCQPVYEEELPKGSTAKQNRVIELYEKWGGTIRIDGTYDATFVAYLKEEFKKRGLNPNAIIPINFTGGKNYGGNYDKVEHLRWIYVPRSRLVGGAKGVMDSGRAVCVGSQTPKLMKALQTAQMPRVMASGNLESSAAAKRRGKSPDILDAFMMTILPIMPRHAQGTGESAGPTVRRLGKVEQPKGKW